MKKHLIYSIILLSIFIFYGCSSSNEDNIIVSHNLKLKNLDIANANYLALKVPSEGRAVDSVKQEIGLFKIDKDGNVTAVMLTCVDGETTRNDLKIVPREICNIAGMYTLLLGCRVVSDEGEYVDIKQNYEENVENPLINLLVRNSDGKIFYIPENALGEGAYLMNSNGLYNKCTSVNKKTNEIIFKDDCFSYLLSVNNEDVIIKKYNIELTKKTYGYSLLDNKIIVVKNSDEGWYPIDFTLLYPNGGFERTDDYSCITQTSEGVFASNIFFKFADNNGRDEQRIEIYKLDFGSNVDKISAEKIVSYDVECNTSSRVEYIVESSDYYLIMTGLSDYIRGYLMDKKTKTIHEAPADLLKCVSNPAWYNTYKGLVWKYENNEIRWFNPSTLQYGTVPFDLTLGGTFEFLSSEENYYNGKLIINGIRNSDSKRISHVIDIETGKSTFTIDNTKNSFTLIPLN